MSYEKALNELKKATMASYLAKTPVKEGMDSDTWNGMNPKNPLVMLHSTTEKKIDGREPMIGHMHLSTAAGIHGLDHKQALADLRVHGEHVGGDKKVRITVSQHQKVWEDARDDELAAKVEKTSAAMKAARGILNRDRNRQKELKKRGVSDYKAARRSGVVEDTVNEALHDNHHDSIEAVKNATTRRIMHSHLDLLTKHGPKKVMDAIDAVAEFSGSGGLEEIGSSDVSAYVNHVKRHLGEEVEQLDESKNTESHPSLWDTHELVHKSGKVLKKGDKVKTDDGTHKIVGFELPHHSGSTGRVYVHDKQAAFKMASYFPGVVDAKIRKKTVKEEAEKIDELKKSTLVGYVKKASKDLFSQGLDYANSNEYSANPDRDMANAKRKGENRQKGIDKVVKKLAKEEAEQIDELKVSTISSLATKRFIRAHNALRAKDYGGYVKNMKKSQKAADALAPKSGWSPEDDPKNEEVVVSPQEKYRQIKEAKLRARKVK